MKISFTKMHGLGNDFVLIDTLKQPFINELNDEELSNLSVRLCRRRFGIGADQLLLLCPSQKAAFRMRIFNADGSEVQMCGNGIRCLAKYVWDQGLSKDKILDVETMAGIIRPEARDGLIRVDMGVPEFRPERIPLRSDTVDDIALEVKDRVLKLSCVSMGNPHAVIIVDSVDDFPVDIYGPLIERNEIFPERTNVEFVEVLNRSEIKMRVWERGAGETLACGTGATASGVITAKKGLTDRNVHVHLLGGDLIIEWEDSGRVYMTGPAETVFEGVISV